MSILKQRLPIKTINELYARAKTYKNRINGSNLEASVINPAYCIVKAKNGPVLPESHNKDFGDIYSGGNMRHNPILKSVTVSHGGNFGMIITADVEIECYTLSDFNFLEEHFCRPGKLIDITFGYAKSYDASAYSSNGKFSDMVISSYEFNTGDSTTWAIKFKAMSGVPSLKSLDLLLTIDTNNAQYKIGSNKTYSVNTLSELVIYHSQQSGTKNISSATHGEVIDINFGKYKSYCVLYKVIEAMEGAVSEGIGMNVYTAGRKLLNTAAYFIGSRRSKLDDEWLSYFPLEYVVALFMHYIKGGIYDKIVERTCQDTTTKDVFKELEIAFDSEASESYIPLNLVSSDPFNVLLVGGVAGGSGEVRGDYHNGIRGIKFAGDCKNFNKINCFMGEDASAGYFPTSHKIDIKKILISSNLLLSSLNYEKSNRSDKTKDTLGEEDDTAKVKVADFFNNIFSAISSATSGAIRLRLSEHPTVHNNTDTSNHHKNKLYIIDEANAMGKVDVVIFDTINGDGVTKTASISSGAGSQTYQAANFSTHSNSESNMICGSIKDKNSWTEEYNTAWWGMHSLVYGEDSKLLSDGFSDEYLTELGNHNRVFKNIRKPNARAAQLIYPGLSCSVELTGIYGFIPGNGMMLTLVTNKQYIDSGRYFYVDSVTHTFQGDTSEWITKLEGKLNMTSIDQIKKIDLRND